MSRNKYNSTTKQLELIAGLPQVDSSLSSTSTNPVQNQAVTSEIQTLNTNVTSLNEALSNLGLTVVDGKLCAVYNT